MFHKDFIKDECSRQFPKPRGAVLRLSKTVGDTHPVYCSIWKRRGCVSTSGSRGVTAWQSSQSPSKAWRHRATCDQELSSSLPLEIPTLERGCNEFKCLQIRGYYQNWIILKKINLLFSFTEVERLVTLIGCLQDLG